MAGGALAFLLQGGSWASAEAGAAAPGGALETVATLGTAGAPLEISTSPALPLFQGALFTGGGLL